MPKACSSNSYEIAELNVVDVGIGTASIQADGDAARRAIAALGVADDAFGNCA